MALAKETNKGKNSYRNKETTATRGKKRKMRRRGYAVCCHLTLTLSDLVCLSDSAFSINQSAVNPCPVDSPALLATRPVSLREWRTSAVSAESRSWISPQLNNRHDRNPTLAFE